MKLSFHHLLFDLYNAKLLSLFFLETINAAISDCIYSICLIRVRLITIQIILFIQTNIIFVNYQNRKTTYSSSSQMLYSFERAGPEPPPP